MSARLLLWNPQLWNWADLKNDRRRVAAEGGAVIAWSCGRTKRIDVGERVFLVRTSSKPKGIVASGAVVGAPYDRPHWDELRARDGKLVPYIEVRFDKIASEPLITDADLKEPPFNEHNWFPQQGGLSIPSHLVAHLEELWATRTGRAVNSLSDSS